MAQVIWGIKCRPRNQGDATSYHGTTLQTGEASCCNCTDQPMMQIEASMETSNYTNLELYRLLKPSNFHINCNISLQVQFRGFLEPISMTCTGHPTKKEFSEFLSCFGVLAPEILNENNDERIACQKILDKLSLTNYQIKDTKVYLKAAHMAILMAQKRRLLERAARTIQKTINVHTSRKKFLFLRKAAIDIQSLCREFRFRKETKAAIHIQAKWRGHREYLYYTTLQHATLMYQCAWRQRLARRVLRQLKIMAARETDALKAAKDQLEKHAEDLILQQELEQHSRADFEEEKEKKVVKLQEELQEMQIQVKEANAAILNEKEVARKVEAPSLVKMTLIHVEDTTKVDSTVEVEHYKGNYEEAKAEVMKLREQLHEMEMQVEEAKRAILKEKEAARKVIEAPHEVKKTPIHVQDSTKVDFLTSEVEQLKANYEEATGEVMKLREQLHEMQMQLEEAKEAILKEKEAARKAIEEAPLVVKETLIYVEDTAKVDSLTVEVEHFKADYAKANEEVTKLREQLHEMQMQLEGSKAAILKEREAARKAIEEAPPKETIIHVQDTAKVNSLTVQVEQLKAEYKEATEEVMKLREQLHKMHIQMEEAKAVVLKEREAASQAIQEAPFIVKETLIHVQNTAKVDSLNAEVEQLKTLLHSEKEASEVAKKAQAESEKRNGELVKKVEYAEKKVERLQDTVQRLEETNSNLEEECNKLLVFISQDAGFHRAPM